MFEQLMVDFTYRDSASREVQLFISFVNFRATSLLHLSCFSTYRGIKTLFLILNICYEHTILVWFLQQSCECSLNQFSTLLDVSLFVHREPQQIFIGVNTEYRANLVKARVNVPVTLFHIYWVCQYNLFFISEGWKRFTKPLNLHCTEYHWSDNH